MNEVTYLVWMYGTREEFQADKPYAVVPYNAKTASDALTQAEGQYPHAVAWRVMLAGPAIPEQGLLL